MCRCANDYCAILFAHKMTSAHSELCIRRPQTKRANLRLIPKRKCIFETREFRIAIDSGVGTRLCLWVYCGEIVEFYSSSFEARLWCATFQPRKYVLL
ncbi:hypothetical protein L596_000149 [Steinernema carpocapsae]|uniref:Uncharacterized protein n=1 Tax=Steinernema carpocapsae TaxID=34508 RepID=A0A4U8UHU1_STECR|nr:hypothetical protein L596_000149 [Steinernema carpocapsae]